MHYRVVEPKDPDAARVLRDVREWLLKDKAMRRDRERLVRVCCAPEPPVSLAGAPRPAGVSV